MAHRVLEDVSSFVAIKPATAMLAALIGFIILRRIFRVVKIAQLNPKQTASYFPKQYTPFQPFVFPGLLFKTTSWNYAGRDWHWVRRFQKYAQNETVNLVPILSGIPGLWTSNIDIGRQVAAGGNRSNFAKTETSNQALLTWGMNLLSAEGLTWRKHRRVAGSSFGTELYKLLWKKTVEIYRDMVQAEGWKDKDSIDIPVIQKITVKFAFLVISACGFGFPSTWETPQAADGSMSAQEALNIVSDTPLILLIVPKWLWYLPIPRLRIARVAREKLRQFMKEQVAERKVSVAAGDTRADVFTTLVKANQDESGKLQLDDQELIGNVFIFLFAGHDTTAHTLAATLGFMAIHSDIQDEVVEQIMAVVGPDHDPEFDDYSKLDKVLAIFYEATRMFPAGHVLIREATEDTVLTIPNPVGEEGSKTIPIPKGTEIMVDMVGVQYNPRYFEDPEMYKPSRWYGLPTDSEQFTAFSVGPRVCLGRKFATLEACCFLAQFLRDWQVLPLLRDGETKEAWGAHIMKNARVSMTLGPLEFPVKLVRRKHV
ncbi:cytochrome P450 [Mycena leptocephala]|nr:cytochrome P450 [Mycena leptocephala]